MAKPFIKVCGGKRQLLPELRRLMPKQFGDYREPFCGGAALFFDIQSAGRFHHLSDANERLIRCYAGVANEIEDVIALLKQYPYEPEFFNRMRALDIDAARADAIVAAWYIYLNRTCFNGLYRVNRAGRFNVPFGRYTNPTICDEENLRACSTALRLATVERVDFRRVADYVGRNDFCYFDPPYWPASKTANFTAYTAGGFGPQDQTDLRDTAIDLIDQGAHVLLSNADVPAVRELYRDKRFIIVPVEARRNVNSVASKRGRVGELLIRSAYDVSDDG